MHAICNFIWITEFNIKNVYIIMPFTVLYACEMEYPLELSTY